MIDNDKKPVDNMKFLQNQGRIELISGTGISNTDYPYFGELGNKHLVDTWFNQYVKVLDSELSTTYPSGSFHNSGCVHISLVYDDCVDLDYIRFSNGDSERTWYAAITGYEQINANTTKIYFSVDYVATFWDRIELQRCTITRRSEQTTDTAYSNPLSDGLPVKNYSLNLPLDLISDRKGSLSDIIKDEVFTSNIVEDSQEEVKKEIQRLREENARYEETIVRLLGQGAATDPAVQAYKQKIEVNNQRIRFMEDNMFAGDSKGVHVSQLDFNCITDFNPNGKFDSVPYLNWQSGGLIGGILTQKNNIADFQTFLTDITNKNFTFTKYGAPNLASIKYVYCTPKSLVVGDKQPKYYFGGNLILKPIFNTDDLKKLYQQTGQINYFHDYKLQNAKLLNYVNYVFMGASGGFSVSPFELPQADTMRVKLRGIGGTDGRLELYVIPRGISSSPASTVGVKMVRTNTFPSLYLAGMLTAQFQKEGVFNTVLGYFQEKLFKLTNGKNYNHAGGTYE